MLLHVLTPFESGYPTAMYPITDGIYPMLHERAMETYIRELGEFEQRGLAALRSLTESALEQGIVAEFTQNIGNPGRMICALAHTWDADLIILGRRGLSGLNELFLGSVSNYVTHHAPCAVLTVQGKVNQHPEMESPPAAEAIVSPK
jgi:nucleotide-binding universal stress UspA family protein